MGGKPKVFAIEYRPTKNSPWQPCPWKMGQSDITDTNRSLGWVKYRKAEINDLPLP